MKARPPTPEEIDELVSFLPRLEGVAPIEGYGGGEKQQDGTITMPWPKYNDVVRDFFHAASKECWCDYEYVPKDASDMLQDENGIGNASLAQIKTMLTFCVRGERFGDGHWAAMIERGHIRRLLKRLRGIQSAMRPTDKQ